MKKFFFSVVALAAAMTFTACSSEEEIAQPTPQWNSDGNGYMAFNLSMPAASGPASRAANDDFSNGLESEFKVNDIALILLCGPNEAEATFRSAYKLADNQFGGVENLPDNITADKKYVHEIKAITQNTGDHIYALVVINHNDVFHVTDRGSLTIGGNPIAIGAKFSDLMKRIVATDVHATQFTKDGFLMLNAPLYDKAGNTASPHKGNLCILTECDGAIYNSEKEAQEAEGAHIYVERAVSKVTMQANADNNGKFAWELTGWQLDNTNSESYIIRHMNEDGKFDFAEIDALKSHAFGDDKGYRMVGDQTTAHRGKDGNSSNAGVTYGTADDKDQFRTYFAYDPNYDKEGTFHDVVKAYKVENEIAADELSGYQVKGAFGNNQPQYCAENTFNVRHQIWGQTTRVLIAATLTPAPGEVLYAHAGDEHFMTLTDLKHDVWSKSLALVGDKYAGLLEGIANYSDSKVTVAEDHDNIKVNLTADLTVKGSLTDTDVAALNIPGITTVDEAIAALPQILSLDLKAADFGYSYYEDGKAFYEARIKHFGDDLTPWNNGEYAGGVQPVHGNVDTIYPDDIDREGNYLGRWGMLRNNWYDLNVSIIKSIGHATPDELELTDTKAPTPDDDIDEEKWINVEVNILSWAKRTNDIVL